MEIRIFVTSPVLQQGHQNRNVVLYSTLSIFFPGLLPFQVPHVDFSGEDYSNCHDAVGSTPPPPTITSGDPWYRWYHTIQPDETEVAKVKKTYKAYLK